MATTEQATATVSADQGTEPPWKTLAKQLRAGDGQAAATLLCELPSAEATYALGRLKEKKLAQLWSLLIEQDIEFAADLLELLPDVMAASLIELLPTDVAAALLSSADSDERVDLLATMREQKSEAVIAAMGATDAARLRRTLEFNANTAGGLMISEILTFPTTATVASVVEFFRRRHDQLDDYITRYLFTVDEEGKFAGVVKSRRLLTASPRDKLGTLQAAGFSHVHVDTSLDDLESLFDRVDQMCVPVVDDEGILLGAVRRAAVFESLQERASANLMRFGGIVAGEELRSMPLGVRTMRRLMFLLPSIGLSYLAVSVIAVFEPVLEQVTVLAVFLPMVANLSGAAGNQAVAVSMRELTLGLIDWRDLFRVWGKEVILGALNGLAVGFVLAVVIAISPTNVPGLPLVVGLAYFLSSILAVVLGGSLPLLMKRTGIDPAMLSSPILTTMTDMVSFFLVLTIAAMVLQLE